MKTNVYRVAVENIQNKSTTLATKSEERKGATSLVLRYCNRLKHKTQYRLDLCSKDKEKAKTAINFKLSSTPTSPPMLASSR
eukprot:c24240_g2_i4 orf=148-393(+)